MKIIKSGNNKLELVLMFLQGIVQFTASVVGMLHFIYRSKAEAAEAVLFILGMLLV